MIRSVWKALLVLKHEKLGKIITTLVLFYCHVILSVRTVLDAVKKVHQFTLEK